MVLSYERIKNLREDADLTQMQLAKKLNITQMALSHYETGRRGIPIDILIKIADYFNCSVDYLLKRTDIKELVQKNKV